MRMKAITVACICAVLICSDPYNTSAFKFNFPVHGDPKPLWDTNFWSWPNHGGGIQNRREATFETRISPDTAPSLTVKWEFVAGDDIGSVPSIVDGIIYAPSLNGFMYAVVEENAKLLWKTNLTESTKSINRTTVARSGVVAGNVVLVGMFGPALVLALNRFTGELLWSTLVDKHPLAVLTMSGTAFKGSFYVGVSSVEENVQICCTFQGSFVKLDIETGNIIWRTPMLPNNGGIKGLYAGAAVWGSSPSIDVGRNLVFIATGNTYSVPPDIEACQQAQNNKTVPDNPDPCLKPDDHSESILAIDLDNGTIVWSKHLGAYDTWVEACSIPHNPNCPAISGRDADFGEAPMMLTILQWGHASSAHPHWRDIVVTGQKNGFFYALDRDNGQIVWESVAGPGGQSGGPIWGSATDGKRVYTNINNYDQKNFTLVPSNKVTTGGGWVALDATNGTVLWSTATPDTTLANGPVAVANGVVFGTSEGVPTGSIYALDAETGRILWSYSKTNGSVTGGPSISNGCVYLGIGFGPQYARAGPDNPGSVSTALDRYFVKAPKPVSAGVNFGIKRGRSLFAFCVQQM